MLHELFYPFQLMGSGHPGHQHLIATMTSWSGPDIVTTHQPLMEENSAPETMSGRILALVFFQSVFIKHYYTNCVHFSAEEIIVIHGGWSDWTESHPCRDGVYRQERICNNPEPDNGGNYCEGDPNIDIPCPGKGYHIK